MKSLYFNRQSLLGEYKTPISIEISVPDNFTLTKTVEELDQYVQKENENGEKLYLKDIYRTEIKEVLKGYDETIEVTDKPLMVTVQKEDEEGNKIYLENIYDGEGNVVDTFETTDIVDENGEGNTPIMIEVQKTTTNGNLLYLKPIIEEIEEEVLDHTEEGTEETETPLMIPKYINVVKDIFVNVEEFSLDEIMGAKYQELLDNSDKDYIIADMFISEDDLDLADSNHSANTGVGLLQLLANGGQAKTKSIALAEPSSEFIMLENGCPEGVEIYLAGNKFVNGKVTLTNPISNCTIKFINTTDRPKEVKCYAIGY